MKKSQFGKGFLYPLVLFIKHMDNDMIDKIEKYHLIIEKPLEERNKILTEFPDKTHDYGWNKDIKRWFDHIAPIWGTPEKALGHEIELWFNGASDHLYEIECPKKFPAIAAKVEKLQNISLKIGHSFTENIWTYEDLNKVRKLALEILFLMDKEIGSDPIKAEYE